ncbi:MAG: ATP-binding protein [Desulfurivibrio sp.]|nr:ATP-binding protein [Desulfurivibrio sp.]
MGALGLMAGGIAHDFNNILTPITMHTEMALREVEPESPLHGSLTQVKKAAERAAALVRQILDYSRQGKHEPMLVKLSMIVKEAVKFLQSATPANIKLNYEINTDRDNIAADPTQLLQVIMNLSLNAIHAMGDQEGLLLISLDETEESPTTANRGYLVPLPDDHPQPRQQEAPQDTRWLKITVRDNGCGITADDLPRLFDPFFTTKQKGEGTGMGLPVVHGIVSRHGGRIRISSEPGKGSSFEIYLPALNGEQEDSQPPETQPLPQGQNEHILLVDDEEAVLEAAASGLSKLNYRVSVCQDPIEALELLRAQQATDFDLLITDYSMPRLKGTELAAAAKVIRAELPIMLCTGYASKIDESAAMAMGISALLMKPLGQENLATEIRRVLDQKTLHLGNGIAKKL